MNHDNFRNRVFTNDIKECEEKGGTVRPITFHDLRHTAATLMIAQGIDAPTVQRILGHEDISTTMRYVHALRDSIKNASLVFSVSPSATFTPTPSAPLLRLVK